jgi:starch synthase
MDGILRNRSDRLFGIVNGIDTSKNDPATDRNIYANFTSDTLDKKKVNKRELQKCLNLPETDAPIIAVISRLVDQKGLDLVAVVMDELMSMDIQLIVLGTGDGRYEHLFRHYEWIHPRKVSANILFDDKLAKRIYAGADMFLMPSLFEPCGLGQLFAMRYGAVPLVRRTGGLVDTVSHFSEHNLTGNGFVFNDYLANAMMWAIREALRVYSNPLKWEWLVKNCMACDFSWGKSAEKYKKLYEKLVSEREDEPKS